MTRVRCEVCEETIYEWDETDAANLDSDVELVRRMRMHLEDREGCLEAIVARIAMGLPYSWRRHKR